MKRMLYVGILVVGLPFLGGCGKQGALDRADLSSLEQGFESRQTIDDVTVSVKQLTPKDREYVFGSKNLTFSPMLMTIDNKGKEDLFFDTEKQLFKLVDAHVNNNNLKGAFFRGGLIVSAACTGFGASLLGVGSMMVWTTCDPGMFLGGLLFGMIGGLTFLLPGISGVKCFKNLKAENAIKITGQQGCAIKKNSKESILLFFEKNKVPALLTIKLEPQTEPLQTLSFELTTDRAAQVHEFVV